MPINFGKSSKTYEIIDIGGDEKIKKRLKDLGFIQGGRVKIIQINSGNIILKINEAKIAIDNGLASKIRVAEIA